MQIKLKKSPNNDTLKTTYSRYRNFWKNIPSSAKIEYDKSLIRYSQYNNKKLWMAIIDITYMNSQKLHTNDILNPTDPESFVNEINTYLPMFYAH